MAYHGMPRACTVRCLQRWPHLVLILGNESSVSHHHGEGVSVLITISTSQHIWNEIRLVRVVEGRNREFELIRDLESLTFYVCSQNKNRRPTLARPSRSVVS